MDEKHADIESEPDDDHCNQEAIVNDKDGRRRAPDSEDRNEAILKCIGYLEITWTHKNGDDIIKRREMGTGTVFHVAKDGTTYVLACAHNVRTAIYCCSKCKNYSFKKTNHGVCAASDYQREIINAKEIRFSRRFLHNEGRKKQGDVELVIRYGDTEDVYLCDTQDIFIDDVNYKSFPTGTSGYDLAIIKFKKKTKYYEKHVKNIRLENGTKIIQTTKEFSIWGFPGDKLTDDKKQNGLWGMKSLENPTFQFAVNNRSNRIYFKQKTIDSHYGTSGAAIWVKEKKENEDDEKGNGVVSICGVHTGGRQRPDKNQHDEKKDEEKKNYDANESMELKPPWNAGTLFDEYMLKQIKLFIDGKDFKFKMNFHGIVDGDEFAIRRVGGRYVSYHVQPDHSITPCKPSKYQRVTESEDKNENIIKCIGYITSQFDEYKNAGSPRGSSTVFHVGQNNDTFCITDAYNVVLVMLECKKCDYSHVYGTGLNRSLKRKCSKCSTKLIGTIIKPTKITFTRYSIHNKYSDGQYEPIEEQTYVCDAKQIWLDEMKYQEFYIGSEGYAVAVVRFTDTTNYYKDLVANIKLQNGIDTLTKIKRFSLWGVPEDKLTNRGTGNKVDKVIVWGGKSSKALHRRMYEFPCNRSSKQIYLKQWVVETSPGFSGASIWIKNQETGAIIICGVHNAVGYSKRHKSKWRGGTLLSDSFLRQIDHFVANKPIENNTNEKINIQPSNCWELPNKTVSRFKFILCNEQKTEYYIQDTRMGSGQWLGKADKYLNVTLTEQKTRAKWKLISQKKSKGDKFTKFKIKCECNGKDEGYLTASDMYCILTQKEKEASDYVLEKW